MTENHGCKYLLKILSGSKSVGVDFFRSFNVWPGCAGNLSTGHVQKRNRHSITFCAVLIAGKNVSADCVKILLDEPIICWLFFLLRRYNSYEKLSMCIRYLLYFIY